MAFIITGDKYKSQLKELNRNYEGRQVWNELYANVDMANKQATNVATKNFQNDITDAYVAAYKNRSDVLNSNYSSGFKKEAIYDIDEVLQQAYDSYKQNYQNQLSTISQSTQEAKSAIDTELSTYADNLAKYQSSTYGYLQDLYNRAYALESYTEEDTKLREMFDKNPLWNRYLNETYEYQTDKKGNVVTDDDGNPVIALDEEGNKIVSDRKLIGEQELYSQLYDSNNNITSKGTDFYDQMLNSLGVQLGEDYGYNSYLYKNNPELYNWSQEASVYDYNKAGTNVGTFKELVGISSTDYEYKFIERYGGVSEQEIKQSIDNISKSVSELINTGKSKDTKSIFKEYGNVITELESQINSLELPTDTKDALLSSIKIFSDELDKKSKDVTYTAGYTTWEDMINAWKERTDIAKSKWNREASFAERAITAGINYSIAPVQALGTFLTGFIYDIVDEKSKDKIYDRDERDKRVQSRRESNKNLVKDIEGKYLDLIAYLSTFGKSSN